MSCSGSITVTDDQCHPRSGTNIVEKMDEGENGPPALSKRYQGLYDNAKHLSLIFPLKEENRDQ